MSRSLLTLLILVLLPLALLTGKFFLALLTPVDPLRPSRSDLSLQSDLLHLRLLSPHSAMAQSNDRNQSAK